MYIYKECNFYPKCQSNGIFVRQILVKKALNNNADYFTA